jgi:hypothetical protein
MLQQLVDEIQSGGTLEAGALALRLHTSIQLIEAMLEHLQRIGYIKSYVRCGDACHGCSLYDSCSQPDQKTLRLWQAVSRD